MTPRRLAAALVLAALPLAGCVTYPPGWDAARQGRDPYEGANRAVFGFNEGVDHYVMGPLATGWTWITFEGMRESIYRFFGNLRFPVRLCRASARASSTARGASSAASRPTPRSAWPGSSSPILFRAAPLERGLRPDVRGLERSRRALLGRAHPRPVGTRETSRGPPPDGLDLGIGSPPASGCLGPLNIVNARALADDCIREARASALDLYVSVRDAYTRNCDRISSRTGRRAPRSRARRRRPTTRSTSSSRGAAVSATSG